jgi:hypothetical protein
MGNRETNLLSLINMLLEIVYCAQHLHVIIRLIRFVRDFSQVIKWILSLIHV